MDPAAGRCLPWWTGAICAAADPLGELVRGHADRGYDALT